MQHRSGDFVARILRNKLVIGLSATAVRGIGARRVEELESVDVAEFGPGGCPEITNTLQMGIGAIVKLIFKI